MQKRKSFFNNEMEQRFSLRKYTIGLCSVCLGFVVIGMGSQTIKADTVNDVEKSSAVQENKAQDTDSANTDALAESKTNTSDSVVVKSNTTPTETKENEAGSVAATAPKTADSNNSASVNTLDQSKSENSSAVAPTSEKTQLQTSQDSSIKSKENSLNNKSNANTPVTNKASHESNSQAQPSSSIDHTQTKLVRRPVMRLAATAATNSDELIVGKDVTISDFSVTTANGRNEFENSHANIKFTMHADDPSAIVGKRLTIQVDKKVWGGFYSSEQQGSNPATISYQGQVIGTLNYGYPFNFVYITFDNHVKDYTSINLQSDLVMAGNSQNDSLYQTDLYTPTQAKDGQTYHLTNDIVIGQQKYSSNLPSTIHYRKLGSESVSSVTDVTTTSYAQGDSKLYAGMFYKTPDGIYYSQSSDYSGNNLYGTKSGQPGYLEGPDLYVGTDIITDHTQSYTATIDIDQTKLSLDYYSKTKPIASYYLNKNYWDDKNLLPNTSDVYIDSSHTYSSTATADATVTKNSVIFNKLNGQSLSTRRFNIDDPTYHMSLGRYTNYINQNGKLYLTPALFKQLQAVAESDQNLTEAINTVKTTGRNAEIKLAKPINTGLKATIKTSDGKTKEVSLLIDTIDYEITTASTAPKGSILVSAQGKTAKVYHPGDQNIPAVVDQNKLTKTITRTINVHEPGEKVTTIKQDVVMTQSVSVVDDKDVTYNGDWKVQGDSQWASYDVPSVPGYTASQSSVAQQAVTDTTKNQTVNITYTANDGTQTIVYQDEDGSEIGKQVISGKTDETVKVTSDVPDGYVLKGEVPSEVTIKPDDTPITVTVEHGKSHVTPDKPVNKGDLIPGTKGKYYPEGLTHNNLNKTVTREVTITDPTGKKSTTTQTVTFTRGATVDEVTNEVTYDAWSENGKHTFDKVDVPTVQGYTASGDVPGLTVTPDSQSINVTVTYNANEQTAKITYIDDTTKTNLDSKDTSGKFGQAITFATSPADEIENYKKQGYVLVSNTFDNNKYQADNSNNVFYVHLRRGTKDVSRTDDVNMTVHYVMDDNSEAPSDNKQTLSFTENGIQDLVTKHIDWTPAASQTFKDVATKSIVGYTSDKENVAGQTVNFGDPDINVTVTYHANTQTAKITYIDDTTTTNLDSKDTSGKFGQAITFATTPADEIENYKKQGYVLVSSTFDNNKYQADNSNNVFYVHLKHDTKDVSRNSNVNMTVHYVMDDNSEAPSDNKQTVNFTENGIQDLVTKHIDWTPAASQTLKDVDSPVLTGYTADIKTANGKVVNFGDNDINVTVHYSANTQTATITYIDDTTKNNLDSKATSGKFGQAITFATAPTDEIANYKKQGYKLVSNDFNDNKYQADNNKNVFHVHFIHDTKNVSRNDDVKMTVHYVMDDGSKAPSDSKQTVSFTESGIKDNVTGNITWMPVASQTLKDVDSPVLTGYTADIKTANGKVVNFGDSDINVTVHYSANTQNAKITYIDDTEKKTLSSDNRNGKFNQVIAFEHDPAEVIKGFEEKGYVFVSDSFDHQKYQADNNSNVFEVHFIHGTKNVSRTDDVNMTVHYVMDDNSEAPSDNKQTVNFTESGIQDLVTKHIDWTPAVSQTFKDVVTPKVAGYTPDQDNVAGQTVNFGDNDVEVTVTYSPNVQLGHINYIDDNTGKTLTRDDFSGRTNEHEDYTSTDRIQEFENKGYELVSNDYPDGGFNFDNNDRQDQVFNVHLKHGTVTVTTKNPQKPNTPINPDPQSPKYPKDISNTNSDVKRTIDYKFKDGKTAQPTVNDSLHFERTVVIDKVTGDVLSDTWTQSQDFNDVQTPAIQGYTPDRTVVSDKNIGHDHQDIIEHVVYSPDAQHMTITYIDDTTGKTLHTDKRDGVSDQDAKYTTSDTIKQYEEQHYKLVSDSTKGKDLIFDHDDDADQTYEVHFIHDKHAIDQTTSPKQTIHYVYANGLTRQGKAADDNVQQLSFKRDGYNDEVTGHDYWNAWTPATSQYKTVDSPVIQGYTPDKSSVDGSTVNPTDKDIEITVTYYADKQTAHIIYVDKTTNATLASDDLSGKSDKDSEYNTEDKIGKYKSQHYVLTEDETNGKNIIFDHNDKEDQTYYVYFVHGTQKVNRQDTVTSTINYKFEDGKTAQPTVTQTKHFSEDGVKDLVTGKIVWDEAKPQKFDDIATKSIVGYTPDKDNVAGSTVKFGDQDVEVTVTYHNNVQTAKIIYIDDTEKKTLGSDKQNGKFNQAITFGTAPTDEITNYEKQGYKLVSNNFKPGIKYQNDNKFNIFEVHLVHTYEPVETSQTITETIHYIDINGKPVAPDYVAKAVIEMTGTRDKVTNSITWNTPSTGHFDEVISPEVPNMTPDKKFIPSRNVQYGDSDITENVVYTSDETSREPEKPNDQGKPNSKTPEKPNKSGNPTSKTSEKSNKSSKEVSKEFGTIAKTTIPEKPIDSRTVDNHASAKTTTKRELPQTGTTANTGIWTGLVSIITSLGLLGASKKRKKN